MNFPIEHKQVKNQDNSYAQCQLLDVADGCPINTRPHSPVAFVGRKCVTPMTFSQKLYQSHELEIAEEFEQAIAANSLEKIKNLLDKVTQSNHSKG